MILDKFKEKDWAFRYSSGYSGYGLKFEPNNENLWIYKETYDKIISLKEDYKKEMEILRDFRLQCLEFGKYPDYILIEYLNNKYNKLFKEEVRDSEKIIKIYEKTT